MVLRGRSRTKHLSAPERKAAHQAWEQGSWYTDDQRDWHTEGKGKRKNRSKSDAADHKPWQMTKTSQYQEVGTGLQRENLRDERTDALITNTDVSGLWHIDFDPMFKHDPKVLTE